jgi:hypothetical protein
MTVQTHPTLVSPVTAESYDRLRILQLVEDAMRDEPYCVCGASMTVTAEGDSLVLECPSFAQPSDGRLAWLRGGIRTVLHERHLIARDISLAA